MKQIIYSTGFFETSLTVEPPEERSDYNAPSLRMVQCQTIVQTPKYEIRKTSQCLTKYVIEDGDFMILKDLNAKSNQALKDLVDKLITYHECHIICNKAKRFREMCKKARSNQSETYEGVLYVETADETSRGCQAFYFFSDGVVSGEQPCKVGEVLELKYDPMNGQFSPIKIVANNE